MTNWIEPLIRPAKTGDYQIMARIEAGLAFRMNAFYSAADNRFYTDKIPSGEFVVLAWAEME